MRAYRCPRCGAVLDLAWSRCPRCGAPVGFALPLGTVLDLETMGAGWKRCIGSGDAACEWLVAADDGPRCESCRLTRTIPAGRDPRDSALLARTELAKRRVIYQLSDVGLPVTDRAQDPRHGLAFDLLSSRDGPVITGHADGVVTIDLAESDDVHRAMLQAQLDEPYRTVVGHIRHEIGHYYWMVLVDDAGRHEGFRQVFGDERVSYQESLERHYRDGAPAGWQGTFVSAYATMHPWEDWAETFAHYLHIRDVLQTAAGWGIVVSGPAGGPGSTPGVVPMDRIEDGSFAPVARDWRLVSEALNALNRSMGHADPYPFELPPPAIDRLELVHHLVIEAGQDRMASRG
jgi:hypothetical protein